MLRPQQTFNIMQQFCVDDDFSTLMNVSTIQVQTEHYGKLLNTMCTNMRNDIENLKIRIKELRQCIEEANMHMLNDDQVKDKVTELQKVIDNFLKQNLKVDSIEPIVQLLHDNIREIQVQKEKFLKRFTLLGIYLFPQITLLENQLQECLSIKISNDEFVTIDMNA